MSNTRKPKSKTTSLARYRSEVKGDPFTLWIDDEKDEKIVIQRPTGDQLFRAEEAFQSGTSKQVLAALCGDKADEVLDVVGGEDAQVMRAIAEDIQEHFGLGN